MTDSTNRTADNHRFVSTTGQEIALEDPRLVVAGYTGRDETAVRAHIDELAEIGVPPPANVPEFYFLEADLLTTADQITVAGGFTSGEVEPVILRHRGDYYLGVGSDHTDRDIERESVVASKAACPKPVGRTVAPLGPDPSTWQWDAMTLDSRVDQQAYQTGSLTSIRRPEDLIGQLQSRLERPEGDWVMLAGTVPLLDSGFISGTTWQVSLTIPGATPLTHTYTVNEDN